MAPSPLLPLFFHSLLPLFSVSFHSPNALLSLFFRSTFHSLFTLLSLSSPSLARSDSKV